MPIERMRLETLQTVLDWAAEEGWNPGLDDAAAFHAADPEGFFVNIVGGRPAAAVSVVNHGPEFAFLGLYLCRPEFRGQGHGLAVWNAALDHAGGRVIGLDGVPAQQGNYRRSGFAGQGRTIRYQGTPPASGAGLRPATASDIPALLARDTAANGVARPAYMRPWFDGAPGRVTMICAEGAATYRRCGTGIKIGPLFADSAETARALLGGSPFPGADRPVFVDIPEDSPALVALAEGMSFAPVFETARMYRGPAPEGDPPAYYAVSTLELG